MLAVALLLARSNFMVGSSLTNNRKNREHKNKTLTLFCSDDKAAKGCGGMYMDGMVQNKIFDSITNIILVFPQLYSSLAHASILVRSYIAKGF